MSTDDLQHTALHAAHVAAGATMVPFAGWSMPVKYTSDVAEHTASRTAAGLFDISHMAQISVTGADAAAFLDHALAGRMSALAPLQSKYTMMLTEQGGIVDDLIVTHAATPAEAAEHQSADHTAPQHYLVVANAANRDAVLTGLAQRVEHFHVTVTDTHRALIAVQGPAAQAILEALGERLTLSEQALDKEGNPVTLATVRYYRTAPGTFDGEPLTLSRTGYTGEDGFELSIDPAHAVALWEALLEVGEPLGLVRAGLAARDTLRLEAGMPLYGHELTTETLPAQAGLGRVVVTAKEEFVGREATLAGPAADAPVLVGLAMTGRRAGRAGYPVLHPTEHTSDGASLVVGEVTSGVLSPTLGHPIAMAYVRPDLAAEGTELAIDVRGTALPATVVALPFYRRSKES
ncbi:glycine cleavage system aminomethyltransferase GcvT [Serinibacter salmoneus]|uniref:aminomethyltransferase n=1 Tax=Serinibacter salmoneus TaxID=556530 RepID=A0A2A9D3Z7_9MICO|nr:glycine cleavage system aminomethyltransferase GcvT [Serinibacter salmoneus]PFG20682.1 aminomethyltransferase [Serinibacter salmoneus]